MKQLLTMITIQKFPCLGDDLAEDDDAEGGADDGDNTAAPRERVQQDGERVVDQDVAQQDRAEQEVAHASDRHDGLKRVYKSAIAIPLSFLVLFISFISEENE